MNSKKNTKNYYEKVVVYLKAICLIIGLIIISTILWIISCEILWYGTRWIEDIYKLKTQSSVYKIIGLVCFLGLGIITVVVSASLVLFGIPFTVVHVDHLFDRKKIQMPKYSTTNNDELQNRNSKQALKWTISILILVIVGLAIGAVGCEVMQWSGLKFKALFNNNNEATNISFYLKQYSFLAIMFAGLLLFFVGFLLAPFMLAFAGVVSFDKKNNSYRLRPRRHHRCHRSHDSIMEV